MATQSNLLPASLDAEIAEAEFRALDSLARYKFMQFGYWAAIWVHLNRISGQKRRSPFAEFVQIARTRVGRELRNPELLAEIAEAASQQEPRVFE